MALFHFTSVARRIRKSMGEETFCTSKGRNIVKMKIVENTSKTPEQQRHRLAWKALVNLTDAFDEVSSVGFPARPRYQSYRNAFTKANMAAISVNEELEVTVAYEQIICSQGRLKLPETTVSADMESRQLIFSHEAEKKGKRRLETDMLHAVLFEKTLEEAELYELNRRDDATSAPVTVPEGWDMEQLCIYVFVLSADGRKASDSKFLEVV